MKSIKTILMDRDGMTAEEAICEVGWRQCGQLYFMADDLGISVGELEALCEYFEIDIEMFEPKF